MKAQRTRLTKMERDAVNLTVKLWNTLHALPKMHPADLQEHARDIHNIQNRIMSRPEFKIANKKHGK